MTTPHERALAAFTDYFVRNYPGPDTIIFDPKWHAPKLFNAAVKAIEAGNGDGWLPIDTAPKDGTEVILAWFGEDRCVVKSDSWDISRSCWWQWKCGPFHHAPTHWRQILAPTPPPASSTDGRGE